MTLHFKYTSWLTYKAKIAAIIASTTTIVNFQIEAHGAGSTLIEDSSGMQSFSNSVHNGIDIKVGNLKPYKITWGDMRDLLKGLAKQCYVQLCEFKFSLASGTRIGGGKIYKA